MASAGSAARIEPACTWLSPRLPRTNTSYSGQPASTKVCLGMGDGGRADPGTVLVRPAPVRHPLGVARTVAGDDRLELGPVRLAEVVRAARGVPAQRRVGQRDAERVGLRHGHV